MGWKLKSDLRRYKIKMMKKLLPLVIFLLLATSVKAQDISPQGVYNDYLFTYGQYRQAYQDYLIARQTYLNYQTLTSKTEAQNKTQKMLEFREETLRTYLIAIRRKLAEETKILNYDQNILYVKLDDEIVWHSSQKQTFSSAGTLEDLIASAKQSQERYPKTEILIYKTLTAILTGKESRLYEKINLQMENLREKVKEIRENGDKDTQVLERWLLEVENRLRRSKDKMTEAQKLVANLKEYDSNKSQVYSRAQFVLAESHQYLKEANSYLGETIKEIKHAD